MALMTDARTALMMALNFLDNTDATIPLVDNPDRAVAMVTIMQITLAHHGFHHQDQGAIAEALLAVQQYYDDVGAEGIDDEQLVTVIRNAVKMAGAPKQRM
jgi:hypothetical protein